MSINNICAVVRFVAQCKPDGSQSYGYHHQQCENQKGCDLHPPDSIVVLQEAARKLAQMNGNRASSMGFTKFFYMDSKLWATDNEVDEQQQQFRSRQHGC